MRINAFFAVMAVSAALVSCAGNSDKVHLFNGTDLDGWEFVLAPNSDVKAEDVFTVKDGNIHIVGQPFGYMRTAQKYADYTLHVEWRWVGEGTNSGIFQRVQDGDKLWPNAIECQLCNGKAGDFVMLGGSKIKEMECVEAFPVFERVGDYEKPVGEWNVAEIRCQGNQITVYINGKLQNQCTCDRTDGYIALQSEGGPIEFRNVYIDK